MVKLNITVGTAVVVVTKEVVEDAPKATNVTNNALFVGSTAELSKLLKQGFLNNKENS